MKEEERNGDKTELRQWSGGQSASGHAGGRYGENILNLKATSKLYGAVSEEL
jgi:hypothetical protein